MTQRKANEYELFMVEIMHTGQLIERQVAEVLKTHGLTMPQYNVLRILRGANETISMGELKNRMLFATSDLSRLMDRLVNKGFAERGLCPTNRRQMDVCISKPGLDVLKKLDNELHDELQGFYSSAVKLAEMREARSVLADVRNAVDNDLERT